jgi:hypothetical protein
MRSYSLNLIAAHDAMKSLHHRVKSPLTITEMRSENRASDRPSVALWNVKLKTCEAISLGR